MSQVSIIDIEGNHPQIPTRFDANVGFAIPIANVLEILGDTVAAGSTPVQTVGSGNTITTNVQISQAIAATDASKVGLSAFNSTQFSVDANGFVSLSGGGLAIDSIALQSGISPIVPNAAGLININGAVVAAGTNPLRSTGTGANTMALEVQISQALAATDATKIGLSNFDSAAFDVDANGFVQLNGGGVATTSFDVQANTAPGTDPVVPSASGIVTVNGAAVANHSVVLETRSRAANAYNLEIQYATSAAATDATKSGVAHFDSTDFSVDANGFVALAGAGAGQTITGDSGGALAPTAGNWNIVGGAALSAGTNASVTSGSGSTLTVTSINCAKWIVDATANRGTHTTIAGAIAAASSGETIFIRPGTYTENLTLKAGVNLTAFECDGSLNQTGHVIISGNATMSTAGTVTITGIQLQTNSAALLTVSGSAASVVNLINCNINCTNNTGISYSSSSSSSAINVYRCTGNLGTTGIALYTMSSAGSLLFYNCMFSNSGSSTTASTNSAGSIFFNYSTGPFAFTTSSTGAFLATHSIFNIGVVSNTTAITTAGTAITNILNFCQINTGSASAVSIGSGTTMTVNNTIVDSTNTNAITGAGTIIYSEVTFQNTSSLINTTSQTRRNISSGGISFDGGTNTLSNYTEGTFVPTMTGGSVAGTTTYTAQNGYYRRIGNLVACQFYITGTAATGTGNVTFGGFPFTIKNQTNGGPVGPLLTANGATFTYPASTTSPVVLGLINTTTAVSWVSGSTTGTIQQMVNTTFNFQGTLIYEI